MDELRLSAIETQISDLRADVLQFRQEVYAQTSALQTQLTALIEVTARLDERVEKAGKPDEKKLTTITTMVATVIATAVAAAVGALSKTGGTP